ncbi:Mini-ribonuclease 3 [Paenibacillus albiflavus]|nr:ribonuclease III domain-containing protein [Paenibacillus albiflavus]
MTDNNPDVQMDMNLLFYPPDKNPALIHPLVLAYVGDAIFELFIRQVVISQPNQRPNYLHRTATRYVSAKAQSKALEQWLPLLTEEEQDVVRRGRNAKSGSIPKNADVLEYRHSTAMECLIGYLHYKGEHARLRELLDMLINK